MTYPADPQGDMTPILNASIEAAKLRHPSGKEVPVEPVVAGLTKADRCDGCGAQAHYRVGKGEDAIDLNLCTHHFRKHYPKMVDEDWFIIFASPSPWVAGQVEGAT